MATPEALEQLRRFALEEQYLAAAEDRIPDQRLLDELGKTVLADFAPVVCKTNTANFVARVKGTFAYENYETSYGIPGAFGGFFVQPVKEELDGYTTVRHEVGFYVLDGKYNYNGYICNVVNSELQDVQEYTQDSDVFDDIWAEIYAEEPDLKQLQSLMYGLDESQIPYFTALLNARLAPLDFYSSICTEYHVLLDDNKTDEDGVISSHLVSNVVNHTIGTDHTFRTLTMGKGSRYIAICYTGPNRYIYMPIDGIIGYEPAIKIF